MVNQTFDVHQDIFKQIHPPIRVVAVDENTLAANPQILEDFVSTVDDGSLHGSCLRRKVCSYYPGVLNTSQYLVGSLLFRQTQRKEKTEEQSRTHG